MYKTNWIGVCVLMASIQASAQTNVIESVPVPVQPEPQMVEADQVAPTGNKTYYVPAQQAQSTYVQQQPTTYVEARPLVKTRADEMRERRQQAEAATEAQIVERLEQARMEDEKRRAERLFGDRFQAPAQEQVEQPVPQPVPVVVPVAPVQTVEPEKSATADELQGFKAEIISEINPLKEEKNKPEEAKNYVSGLVGIADYSGVSNIDANIATGFAFGRRDASGFNIEGSFIYSNYYVDEGYWSYGRPIFSELDQYNLGVGVSYSPLKGRIRPNAGGIVSYVYRKYGQFYSSWSGSYDTGSSAESRAFDLGVTAGIDVDVTDNFTVGFDYKYMMNISSKTSSPYLGSRYVNTYTKPIEDLNYQMFTLSAKASF
ncbi:MAG: hypothetical protein KDD61_04200 [Bdellovibrionales bacterium]|nr:hypothetical protein [Bdellovibrionales bacterium]